MTILFVGATHGDESIGPAVLRQLQERSPELRWVIGNEYAYRQGTRRFEGDLNRSAPGAFGGKTYEQRRAAELIALSQRYDAYVDVHGTDEETGLFLIVTNPSVENLQLARRFPVERVVILPAITPDLQGPVSEYVPCGLEIECGSQGTQATREQLRRVLECVWSEREQEVDYGNQQTLYELYAIYRGDTSGMREFVEAERAGERFTPLFIDSYGPNTCMQLRIRR